MARCRSLKLRKFGASPSRVCAKLTASGVKFLLPALFFFMLAVDRDCCCCCCCCCICCRCRCCLCGCAPAAVGGYRCSCCSCASSSINCGRCCVVLELGLVSFCQDSFYLMFFAVCCCLLLVLQLHLFALQFTVLCSLHCHCGAAAPRAGRDRQ